MQELRAFAYAIGRAIVLLVLAIWFVAASAGAYAALFFFWPFLSVCFLVVWAVCRIAGMSQPDTVAVTIERPPRHSVLMTIGGSDRPMGRRVLTTIGPPFSVEIAQPRWFEVVNVVVWAPFFLQGPLLIGLSLCQLAAQEEPRIVVEWSWLPIGALLVAGFVASTIAFMSYAARHFVEPGTIGRRVQIPFTDRALCAAHRDVCAIELQRGPEMLGGSSFRRLRVIRKVGEPQDLTMGAPAAPDAPAPKELLALARVLAHAARVPLRVQDGDGTDIGTRNEYQLGLSPHETPASPK